MWCSCQRLPSCFLNDIISAETAIQTCSAIHAFCRIGRVCNICWAIPGKIQTGGEVWCSPLHYHKAVLSVKLWNYWVTCFWRGHLQCDFIKQDSVSERNVKKRKIGGNTVFVGQLTMKIFILYFLPAFTLTPSSLIWPEDDKKWKSIVKVDCLIVY